MEANVERAHHHHKRRLSTGQKALRVIGIVLAVLVGLAAAIGLGLLIALVNTGAL